MDTGEGEFKQFMLEEEKERLLKEHPNHGGVFRVGEELTIKGSLFRVKSIKPKELRLKLLKKST